MKFTVWMLALGLLLGGSDVIAARGKAKAKPKAQEAQWDVVGVFAKEDFASADDYESLLESLEDLDDTILRNYQRFEGRKDAVLVSKKKIFTEELEMDGKKYAAVYGQEQLGKVQILEKATTKKAEAFKKALEDLTTAEIQGKLFELYSENDPSAPARCWAEGTRVLTPPYHVRNFNECVRWARSTGVCRQVEMQNNSLGCHCYY